MINKLYIHSFPWSYLIGIGFILKFYLLSSFFSPFISYLNYFSVYIIEIGNYI